MRILGLGLIVSLLVPPQLEAQSPFEDLDVFQIEYPSDVQIAPTGDWVVSVHGNAPHP